MHKQGINKDCRQYIFLDYYKSFSSDLLEDDHWDNLHKPHIGRGSAFIGLDFSFRPIGRHHQEISLLRASLHHRFEDSFNQSYFFLLRAGLDSLNLLSKLPKIGVQTVMMAKVQLLNTNHCLETFRIFFI